MWSWNLCCTLLSEKRCILVEHSQCRQQRCCGDHSMLWCAAVTFLLAVSSVQLSFTSFLMQWSKVFVQRSLMHHCRHSCLFRPHYSLHEFQPLVLTDVRALPDKQSANDPLPTCLLQDNVDILSPLLFKLYNRFFILAQFRCRSSQHTWRYS